MSFNIRVDDYVLCDDERSLRDAIDAINLCSQIIFDCEGQNLGQQGGSLSLMSFRTIGPEISKTYLIDVLSLTNDTLRPVFDVIQSSSPIKIVFDGRMDYTELFHGNDIPIRGVLDLQLADIYSRRLRGEDEEDQQRRLSPYLKRGDIDGNPACYRHVQKLCSLEQCLREHDVGSGIQFDHIQGNLNNPVNRQKSLLTRPSVNHEFWLKRPLPEEYLRYAAWDVYFIGLLYDHFKDKDYITDQLSAQSERYVAIWQDAKPKKTDAYRGHALLPLQILDHTSYGPFHSCMCCQRNLSKAAFSTNAWGKPKQRRCWICRAIYLKVQVHARSNYDSDSEDDYYCDSDDYGLGRCDFDDFSDGYGSDNYGYNF